VIAFPLWLDLAERLRLAEERRLAELKSDKAVGIPAEKVRRKVRSALR
jgi:hypothetical protein